jgi:hypothetical protein
MNARDMDVMPCQLCPVIHGQSAHFSEDDAGGAVHCPTCMMYGPEDRSIHWSAPVNEKDVRAIELWNRMQGLIAHGLLSEAMGSHSKNEKGRL